MKRGTLTIADLRAHCDVNHDTGCWIWRGGCSNGAPRLWTFDHERGEKRTMTGPKGVWNIAHQEAPRKGWLAFHRCQVELCMQPVHMGLARDRDEIGRHIQLGGFQKGTMSERRIANLAKAREAQAMVYTPREVVLACRAAGSEMTHASLARLHGIGTSTVSRIRRRLSRGDVVG